MPIASKCHAMSNMSQTWHTGSSCHYVKPWHFLKAWRSGFTSSSIYRHYMILRNPRNHDRRSRLKFWMGLSTCAAPFYLFKLWQRGSLTSTLHHLVHLLNLIMMDHDVQSHWVLDPSQHWPCWKPSIDHDFIHELDVLFDGPAIQWLLKVPITAKRGRQISNPVLSPILLKLVPVRVRHHLWLIELDDAENESDVTGIGLCLDYPHARGHAMGSKIVLPHFHGLESLHKPLCKWRPDIQAFEGSRHASRAWQLQRLVREVAGIIVHDTSWALHGSSAAIIESVSNLSFGHSYKQKQPVKIMNHDMSCHTVSCHTMSFHAAGCHAVPCHSMPCRSCHAMPCHSMPCHSMSNSQTMSTMPCHATPCHAAHVMPCHVIPCHSVKPCQPCHAMPLHAMPLMSRHAMSFHVIQSNHVMPYHAMPLHAMSFILCHAMRFHVIHENHVNHAMPCHSMLCQPMSHTSCHAKSCQASRRVSMVLASGYNGERKRLTTAAHCCASLRICHSCVQQMWHGARRSHFKTHEANRSSQLVSQLLMSIK